MTDIPQSAPDCSLCGAENEGIHWVPVTNEATGETIDADLCDDCLDKTEKYDSGKEVGGDV